MSSKYFSDKEIACPCCGQINPAVGFLGELDSLREAWGKPMTVNSMCRCEAHNAQIEGRGGSMHLITHEWGCCAVDISTVGWSGIDRAAFVKLAQNRNFSVGIAHSFIHIDLRTLYAATAWPKPVLFTY